jgi:beta-phosphoglucomutase-like phosphatase (HAD superfamily)
MNDFKQSVNNYLERRKVNKIDLKGILFDMDGVLYDSMKNHAVAWVKTMLAHGVNMTEEDVYMHEGRTGDSTIDIISKREGLTVDPDERRKIYLEKTDIFNACPPVKPMFKSKELLHKISGEGLTSLLVTGSGQSSLLDNLNSSFPGVFIRERMVTSFDVTNGKPDPEPYLLGLKKGGLKSSEAIVVENAPLGIQAATSAGIFTIAVNTGELPDSVLIDAGADYLYPSIESLFNDWDNIRKILNN